MEKVLPNWMRYKGMNKWLKEEFDYCMDNTIDLVEHFNGLDEFDKERFLRGCFKNHNRIQVLKNQIDKLKTKLLEPYSFESMWKIHSQYQNQIYHLKKKFEKNDIKEKNQIIENQKVGEKSLIKRNVELQNRIFHEEKVNRILKKRLKKFELKQGGGDN